MVQARAFLPDPRPLALVADARQAKRKRATARVEAAVRQCPALRIDRLTPVTHVLRSYRVWPDDPALAPPSPLAAYIDQVKAELADLEAWVASLPKPALRDGAVIRRALCFLKGFGRISALDFELVPTEERERLVELLRLEYRWCFAAAGTTPRAFKVAIGRTGAR